MKVEKSHWVTDGDNVHLSMPLTKVDKENRTVSGFATLDNVDEQGDIVLSDASRKAFARFRGNIREMHQPIAAGRVVDFREESYYNKDDGQTYKGIYVTVYVSKGAQDTWEKVLDGTLTGFSIGGSIIDSEQQWSKDRDANVRLVKDYELIELSLVDNPANQLANVFSVQKSADGTGSIIKGMVAEVTLENIFWCENDEIAKQSIENSATCAVCGNNMVNIGFLEEGDTDSKVGEVVSKFLDSKQDKTPVSNEGGDDVSEVEKKNEVVVEKSETVEEVAPVEEAPEAAVEEVKAEEEVVETETEPVAEEDNDDISKMISELQTAVSAALEKNTDAVKVIEERVEEITKSFETKTSEHAEKMRELGNRLDEIKNSSGEVAKRLEALEGETAVRKSADYESAEHGKTELKKSARFEGVFLGDLLR